MSYEHRPPFYTFRHPCYHKEVFHLFRLFQAIQLKTNRVKFVWEDSFFHWYLCRNRYKMCRVGKYYEKYTHKKNCVRLSNGLPSHVTSLFQYWTTILSSIQMNPVVRYRVFRWLLCILFTGGFAGAVWQRRMAVQPTPPNKKWSVHLKSEDGLVSRSSKIKYTVVKTSVLNRFKKLSYICKLDN